MLPTGAPAQVCRHARKAISHRISGATSLGTVRSAEWHASHAHSDTLRVITFPFMRPGCHHHTGVSNDGFDARIITTEYHRGVSLARRKSNIGFDEPICIFQL